MARRRATRIDSSQDWADGVLSQVVGKKLPTTAQSILSAAQRVLARDGYDGLTVRGIAEEALETKSLVLYHFGRLANLEALLVDSLWHDIDAGFVGSIDELPGNASTRIDALIRFYAGIAANDSLWRMYYALVPSVIWDSSVRANLARIYESYRRDIDSRCLCDTEIAGRRVEGLAGLFLAVGEGVPMQSLMGPVNFDQSQAFSLFGDLVKQYTGVTRRRDQSSVAEVEAPGLAPWPQKRNPDEDLPKPARRILKVSRRLLERKGLKALTLDSIARASGQPRSSVGYYFESKQGLIEALFASILYSYQHAYVSLFSDEAAPTTAELEESLYGRSSPLRAFFLMMPALLQDETLRSSGLLFHDELRSWLARRLLHRSEPEARAVASVLIAGLDGLSIQMLYDPTGPDWAPALTTMRALCAAAMDQPLDSSS